MFSVTAAGEKRAYKFLARWAYLCCVFTACAQQTPSCDCLTEGLSSVYLSFFASRDAAERDKWLDAIRRKIADQ